MKNNRDIFAKFKWRQPEGISVEAFVQSQQSENVKYSWW